MGNNEITINGVALASMGATLLSGAYAELLAPPSLKDFVENNDPLKDGTEVIVPGTDGENDTSTPKLKERDVTLTFLIQGDSKAEFFTNYAAFVAMLHKGRVNLSVPELNRYFYLIYSNSTQFANYMLNACKLAVKFREPIPTVKYIDNPDGPEPEDPNTTADELGIRWYNEPIRDLDTGRGVYKVSEPITAFSELASFRKQIDGKTINYYNRSAIMNIATLIANKYYGDSDSEGSVFDPIYLMAFSGLCTIYPISFRTVWQPVKNNEGTLIRGDTIVEYPQMGYYKNGIWYPDDVFFLISGENVYINKLSEENGELENITIEEEDVAIPMKVLIEAVPKNGASTASTMSLFGSRK